MKAHIALQEWWARTGTGIATEMIPEARIVELEHRYRIVLPDDFREFLRLSSPVEEAWDDQSVTWWHFERIRNIPDEYPHELSPIIPARGRKFLFYADYAIWCWAWAISCADDETRGKVLFVGGRDEDRFVADSFSDFVRKYLNDWRSVC